MEPILPLPEANTPEANAEVIVSGAGPVGLLLGCLLKQSGVDVAIVDPHVFPGEGSKAAVTMPRSFEQLELANVGDRLATFGRKVASARMCLGGGKWTGEITGFGTPSVLSRHSPRTVGQNFIEEALNRRFLELGGRFYRGARFTSYTEVGDGLEVTLEHAPYARPPIVLPPMPSEVTRTMKTTVKAKYLVGCDGKRSDVRTAMGASYEGHDYEETFLLADVEIPQAEVERTGWGKHIMNVIIDSETGSFVLLIHLQETRWRTYFCQKGLNHDNLTPEFIQQKWKQHFPAPGPFVPTEFKDMAFFEVSCKLAETFRKGRVMLAGDAAHCHSPAGGQGMNTGLQDAANLAWKISSVLRGHASDKLLESYELERKPIAEWVLSTSDAMFQGVSTQTSATWNIVRRLFLKMILGLAPEGALPPKFLVNKMFGLSISYADNGTCKLIGTPLQRGALRAGDRLPDIECRDMVSSSNSKCFTLSILSSPPHDALRVMFCAETSTGLPSDAEIDAALSRIKCLHSSRGVPLEALMYMSGSAASPGACGGWFNGLHAPRCLPHSQDSLMNVTRHSLECFAPLRMLVPADANAHKQSPCAEVITLLGLGAGGRAVLVVRPDGYIAVAQLGSWAAAPVVSALEELGIVVTA